MDQDLAPKTPLSRIGRILFGLNIIGLVVIFALGLYGYLIFEGTIPTHYDFAGTQMLMGQVKYF